MASRTFKYRKQRNYSYAPGEVTSGFQGEKGNQGEHGAGVYFVDYDLSNSHDIDTALQKIRNGMLPGSESAVSAPRAFKAGDMIISSSLNCYMLTGSGDSMDMVFKGSIIQSTNWALNNIDYIEVFDLTNTTVNYHTDTSIIVTNYDSSYMAPIPTNENIPYSLPMGTIRNYLMNWKCYDLMVASGDPETSYYRQAFNKTGKWYKACIRMIDYGKYKDYRFNVVNDMPCTKSMIADAHSFGQDSYGTRCADTNLVDCLQLNKSITFPVIPVPEEKSETCCFLFNETVYDSGTPRDASVTTMFVSDIFLDRLHPGNDIKVPIIQSEDASIFVCDVSTATWHRDASISQSDINQLSQSIYVFDDVKQSNRINRYDIGNSTYFSGMMIDQANEPNMQAAMEKFLFSGNTAYAYIADSPEMSGADKMVPEINTMKVTIKLNTDYANKIIDVTLDSLGKLEVIQIQNK